MKCFSLKEQKLHSNHVHQCRVTLTVKLLLICFRRKSNRKEKIDEQTKPPVEVCPHPSDPVEMRRQHYQTPGKYLLVSLIIKLYTIIPKYIVVSDNFILHFVY